MQITFFGAAREVTGSCNFLEAAGQKILIDCGMYQGGEFNEKKNHEPLPFDAKEISAAIITHAHLDHVGRLPILAKEGFNGTIYATPATIKLARLILEDALEVMRYNERHLGHLVLYGEEDIAEVMSQLTAVEYGAPQTIGAVEHKEQLGFTLRDAGHIFGSAFVEIQAEGKRVVFSGDIGNINVPIIRDTEILPPNLDALVCESTYGGRVHEATSVRQEIIEKMVADAIGRGGTLMIPSFSVERTQELLYELNDLVERKHRLPSVPIFLDSPLAIGVTKVFREYPEYYDEQADYLFKHGDDLFNFAGLTMCETREQSKRINQVPAPKIIIAGAGMMNGGRIVHHALRYLADPQSTLLIIGYQAQGTLGRKILDGESPVWILGEKVPVRCQVKAIGALSAHGDREKLLNWIGGGTAPPKKVYLNHGEPDQSDALASRLKNDLGVKATVVNWGLMVKV